MTAYRLSVGGLFTPTQQSMLSCSVSIKDAEHSAANSYLPQLSLLD